MQYREDVYTKQQADRVLMMGALIRCGVATVTIHFDGSGDDGQIQDIEVNWLLNGTDKTLADFPLEGKLQMDTGSTVENGQWIKVWREKENASVQDLVEEVAYAALTSTGVDWVNNDGGFGEIIITPAEDTIEVQMSARVTTTEDSVHAY